MTPGAAFEHLVRLVPAGLVVWQLDADLVTLRLVYANPRAAGLAGVEFSQHIGHTMADVLPDVPIERHRRYGDVARSASADAPAIRFADSRGERTTFAVWAFSMPEHCVGVLFQDLQEQAAELAKREERFRALLENSGDAVILTDARGSPFYASASLSRIVGHQVADVVGTDPWPLLHPDDLPRMRRLFQEMLAHPGRRFEHEMRARHADGSWRTLEVVSVNRLEEPGVAAIVANFRDITERRRIEAELKQTEDQFRRSQKLEGIGRLAAGVAHDFNNMLTVMLSYTELLLADATFAQGHAELGQIKRAGERASELTRQLLAFGRQQVLLPQVVNLNAALSAIEPMLRRIIGEDIDLRLVGALDLWNVQVDPGQLEQVIVNLVVNARDAMPNGGVLTLETENVILDDAYAQAHLGVTPGPHAMLAVSDTGHGMNRETQECIFEPFFSTKEQGKGTGLGLAMVFGIVKQSGGSIWLYSEEGKGSTFKLYFPQVLATQASVRPSEAPRSTPRGTETVLLVEDDADVRAVTRTILSRLGYRVLEAASADAALLISEKTLGDIHLLLTDVVMPRMSGIELAAMLRARRPELRVLYVSGYTENGVTHHGALEGGAFLQKPLTPGALARKVRDILGN